MKKSVTIIISHYKSLPFLRTCLRQIEKYKNPDIEQSIVIIDQSTKYVFDKVIEMIAGTRVIAYNLDPLYSGYGIDYICRTADLSSDYICQLHADAFPISKNWLKLPITLMEENNLTFTGVLQFICDQPSTIYPYKGKTVFGMAQCFNIGRTDVYKEMSLEGGFTRFHNRSESGLTFKNNDWHNWAIEDYKNRGSDDDVPAFFWEDNNRQHDKLSFGFTGKMGKEGEESNYGTIIEDLVFHFGFHREAIGVMPKMGAKYAEWTRRINQNYSDELIDEMLSEARKQPLDMVNMRKFYNGTTKVVSEVSEAIQGRINKLKNGLD